MPLPSLAGAPYYVNEYTQESTWSKPQAGAYAARPKKFSMKANSQHDILKDEPQLELPRTPPYPAKFATER